MSQYIYYKFDKSSTTITNYGSGGAGWNGAAARNQYATDSAGHPRWGPLTGNQDVIHVPGGLSNPYQHTWQIGLNIQQWWPVKGIDSSGILCGNDGKLFSYANDQYYAYLHEEGSTASGSLVETGIHHFTFEIADVGSGSVEFWLGVGSSKPVQISTDGGEGDEGGRHWWDFDYNLQLNTNYYFQIVINLSSGVTGSDYYIGNCAPGCADTMVVGFPCGCYIYSWREDNTVLDLSGGGNWKDDVGCWAGGTCGGAAGGGGGGGGGPGSVIPAITGGNTFGGNSEINILPYLTQNHQGQPTPGMHSVELSSADGIRSQVTASVRVRDWQPKNM
jgi:hypothetical protein